MSELTDALKKAEAYGIGEFLEIIGELSQESTKKGALSRQEKELIILGIALSKDCDRCIQIHTQVAISLNVTEAEIEQVRRIHLFLQSSPSKNEKLWKSWKNSWRQFSLANGSLSHYTRELVALGIALSRHSPEHIKLHTEAAVEFGAKPKQVFETMPIVLLMDGAPAISQIPCLMNALEGATAREEAVA